MSISVKFDSHKKEIEDSLQQAMDRAMETAGMMAETQAKRNLTSNGSVDTGLLRNSITFAVAGKPANIKRYKADNGDESGSYSETAPKPEKNVFEVYVGTNVEYAPYVELGTRFSRAKPYLHPAAQEIGGRLKEIVQTELQKG